MKTKTYVVTGSTSGIGRALINKLKENNIVFAGYRNPAHKEVLASLSPNIYPFYIDYSRPETIKLACEYILSKCTKIDTIINVAGCVVAGPVEKINIDEIRRQFDVNVFGHLELSQHLIPILESGKIINISSMASYGFFPFISPYCASKKALDIFFNALNVENKKNIKVVSVKPGVIATPLWGKSINENSKYFEQFEEYSDEMKYVIKNAEANEKNGLSVNKVIDTIIKIDSLKNPKPSYTVGKDAFCAKILSKFPQNILNKIIKFGIKQKIKNK